MRPTPPPSPEEPQSDLPPGGQWQLALTLPEDFDNALADRPFAREVVLGPLILAIVWHQSQWHAIDGMCSHQGGPLAQGHFENGCVTCPWHGWQYELATGIQTINRQPLQAVYPARRRGKRIEVQLQGEIR